MAVRQWDATSENESTLGAGVSQVSALELGPPPPGTYWMIEQACVSPYLGGFAFGDLDCEAILVLQPASGQLRAASAVEGFDAAGVFPLYESLLVTERDTLAVFLSVKNTSAAGVGIQPTLSIQYVERDTPGQGLTSAGTSGLVTVE